MWIEGCDDIMPHMLRLTTRDLQYRAGRLLILVIVLGLVFMVVLVTSGFSRYLRDEVRQALSRIGADNWVVRKGDTGPFTTAASLPEDAESVFEESGAKSAEPAFIANPIVNFGGSTVPLLIFGYEPGGFAEPRIREGRLPRNAREGVSSRLNVGLGTTVRVADHSVRIVGITDRMTLRAGVSFLFMRIKDAQQSLVQGRDVSTALMLRGESPQVPGYRLMSTDAVVNDAALPLKTAADTTLVISALMWMAATALIGGIVYTSALTRVREFAVIKSLGGANPVILGSLVIESVVIAVVAATVGGATAALVIPRLPLPAELPVSAYVWLAGFAIGAGLVASLGAVRRAATVDPAIAFSAD